MEDENLHPAVRWVKRYWAEGDVMYYFELDIDGWARRQVELRGPEGTPIAASSRLEFPDEDEALAAYLHKYGNVADQLDPDGKKGDAISAIEFENIWQHARAFLERTK